MPCENTVCSLVKGPGAACLNLFGFRLHVFAYYEYLIMIVAWCSDLIHVPLYGQNGEFADAFE